MQPFTQHLECFQFNSIVYSLCGEKNPVNRWRQWNASDVVLYKMNVCDLIHSM